jgi:hypothetical protein
MRAKVVADEGEITFNRSKSFRKSCAETRLLNSKMLE